MGNNSSSKKQHNTHKNHESLVNIDKNKIDVIIFTLGPINNNNDNIDDLLKELIDAPQCCTYSDDFDDDFEDSSTPIFNYIICVTANVDINDLCKKHNMQIFSIHKMKIQKEKYNNQHQINFDFSGAEKYKLTKISLKNN